MSSELEKIILAYPNSDLYLIGLSKLVSLDFIFENPQIQWNYYHILNGHKDMTLKYVLDNIDKFSYMNDSLWVYITKSPFITMKDIDEHQSLPWVYSLLGHNPNVTMEMLDKYHSIISDVKWNKRITVDYINNNSYTGNEFYWFFSHEFFINLSYNDIKSILHNKEKYDSGVLDYIAVNSSLPFEQLVELLYPEYRYQLCSNENVTEEYLLSNKLDEFRFTSAKIKDLNIVKNNPDLPWDYKQMSSNKYITIQFIKDIGIDKDWVWSQILPRLSLEDIDDNMDFLYNLEIFDITFYLFDRDDITLDFILKYIHLFPDKKYININDISLKDVDNHPEITWNYYNCLWHKDITLEFFEKYIDKILN